MERSVESGEIISGDVFLLTFHFEKWEMKSIK